MRLVTYRADGAVQIGAVEGDEVVDLSAVAPTMLDLIEQGPQGLSKAREALAAGARRPLAEVRLLAPIPRPRKNIVCLGMNYAEHAYESARSRGQPEVLPEHPVFFSKPPTTVNDPDGPIPYWAGVSEQIDWEVELGFVIGRAGIFVRPEEALDYVFGYTIVNDVSARDVQNRHQQFLKGKSLDGFCPMGPSVVTADEFGDPQRKQLRLRVNGVDKQDSTTADMIFPVDHIIEWLSKGLTLQPGDIIATGTPEGVGMGRTPMEFLQEGDVVETEIEGIGVLRNRMTRIEHSYTT